MADETRLEAEQPPAPERQARRLRRSRRDRVLAGVCGGLGEYLGVDPVLVRIAALLLVFAGGAGLVLYLLGWLAIPEEPEREAAAGVEAPPERERRRGAALLGLVFVALGALFLLDELFPDLLRWRYVWPVALIVVGLLVLARARA